MKLDIERLKPFAKYAAIAVALLGVCAWAGVRLYRAKANPTSEELPLVVTPSAPADAAVDAGVPQGPTSAPVIPTSVQLVFSTSPPAHATVTWGKKRLGRIEPRKPLVVTRPRDSGPLDVIVRAEGFMDVHTRAHTFSDTKIAIKLTPPDQKNVLLGYRVPIDAGVPVGPDGLPVSDAGVPAEPSSWSLFP